LQNLNHIFFEWYLVKNSQPQGYFLPDLPSAQEILKHVHNFLSFFDRLEPEMIGLRNSKRNSVKDQIENILGLYAEF
jgi:hypothetical protein